MENLTKSRFQKGISGNPAGRKPGQTTGAKLRAQLANEIPAILDKLIEAAKGGDATAAKLVLDRCLPALRPIDLPQAMPMAADASLSDQGRAVLAAVAAGVIPASVGSQIMASLSGLAKVIEVNELSDRIAALEATNGDD